MRLLSSALLAYHLTYWLFEFLNKVIQKLLHRQNNVDIDNSPLSSGYLLVMMMALASANTCSILLSLICRIRRMLGLSIISLQTMISRLMRVAIWLTDRLWRTVIG